jgi:hypothetical protein
MDDGFSSIGNLRRSQVPGFKKTKKSTFLFFQVDNRETGEASTTEANPKARIKWNVGGGTEKKGGTRRKKKRKRKEEEFAPGQKGTSLSILFRRTRRKSTVMIKKMLFSGQERMSKAKLSDARAKNEMKKLLLISGVFPA